MTANRSSPPRPRAQGALTSHGCRHPRSRSRQRTRSRLRPREPRASSPGGRPGRAGFGAEGPAAHDRRQAGRGHGQGDHGAPAARAPQGARDAAQRLGRRGPVGRRGSQGGGSVVAVAVVRRPGRDPAQGGRAALRPVAREAQRRDDAGPVARRHTRPRSTRLRADRLLADQRPLRPRRSSPSSRRSTPRVSGTAATTARWRVSSTRSPRSTSPRSPATCRPLRR